ncbi:hypothetical protein K505DRAFT_272672 [Melanomma pulvis-pyrius CBS 109.77]|uniref:Uncharacterized protein n=1 Tax=Melanomma pulvis-pyrius CBS 109.77 TaxID=1314802 RepID=A0A6A6XHP8_9PLEO|nr:hypothetical protein K505DRAFT_272672 [Melanomma pulvis-pyrius CBS 109.77]
MINDSFGDPNDWSMGKLHKLFVGGQRTKFSLIQEDELPLLNAPYKTWASAPYDQLGHSIMDKASGEFFHNGHAIIPQFPARLHTLKVRLWTGMVPMSGGRWREKKLDDPKNIEQFRGLIQDIFKVFEYLNLDQVQEPMRHGFNWLSKEYGVFESAVNLRREQKGIPERMNITAMWAEYFQAVVTNMSNRAHRWVIERADEIQIEAKTQYETVLSTTGNDVEAIKAAGQTFYRHAHFLNDVVKRADVLLNLPMQGYEGHNVATTEVQDLSLTVREDAYNKLVDAESTGNSEILKRLEIGNQSMQDMNALLKYFDESRKNIVTARKWFRGEAGKLGDEHWITILKSRINYTLRRGGDPEQQKWGFVCYRLTYKQSPEEWAQIKEKIEDETARSGQWVQGADDVRNARWLQWIDGQELGIAEGDIQAAKRHFSNFVSTTSFMPHMWKQDFLVVDQHSYFSYKQPFSESVPPGDNGGHVRLVDTIDYNPEMIRATSPGFTGDLKILTSLVFDEVYPLLASYSQRPRELWPLARLHPRQVYVGPTVAIQERQWEMIRQEMATMMPAFYDFLRKKKEPGKGDGA